MAPIEDKIVESSGKGEFYTTPANQWAHVIIRFEALIFPKKPLLAHKRSGNFGLLLHCRPVNDKSRAAAGMIYS